MVDGIAPDIGFCFSDTSNTRSSFTIQPISIKTKICSVKTKHKNSFLHKGVHIFNSLPISIRYMPNDLNTFKAELDKLLNKIPDSPEIPAFVLCLMICMENHQTV